MDFINMKDLIKKNIIDFSELVLNNYQKIGLDETDAIIIIKLQYLLNKNITYISAKKLSEVLSISHRTTAKRLDSLIDRKYISLELIQGTNGKETESFNLDYIVQKIIMNDTDEIKNITTSNNLSDEAKIVQLFETELKRQLSVLDIQTITKWLSEDKYTFDEINDALFEAVKVRKTSIRYIDAILLQTGPSGHGQQTKRKAVISDLRKIWEE